MFNNKGLILDNKFIHENFHGNDFAQGPKVLINNDFLRIYFSTRRKDKKNYFSEIRYVDLTKDLSKIINVSSKPVIVEGGLGCYYEHGIFPFQPISIDDELYGFATGWSRRESVDIDMDIGLFKSIDSGKTFQEYFSGPVISKSVNEPFLIGDACVRNYNNMYFMWYIFGTEWIKKSSESKPERNYKIGFATSDDGKKWFKNGENKKLVDGVQIISNILTHEAQAMPSVAKIGDGYLMVFCYRDVFDFRLNPINSYKIGAAYSYDLQTWERCDDLVRITDHSSEWDKNMRCYPEIFSIEDQIFLLYNGNDFGKKGIGYATMDYDKMKL